MSKILKSGIAFLSFLCVALVVILLVDVPEIEPGLDSPVNTETPIVEEPGEKDLAKAVEIALANSTGRWQEFDYKIDNIQVQDDGQMAIVWLAPIDSESGEFLGREPELALAELNDNGEWQILLEDETGFSDSFKTFQYADKNFIESDIFSGSQKAVPKGGKVYGGYYLPWAASLEKRLTWSVAHSSCYPIYYCTHAFDFADGSMFPIVAAKGGTVFHWRDTCTNGDSSCTNSITLQDKSTTPWTYQIYAHIAQGSVPDNLREVGTPVRQGQFIANADDTGYSTANHLHFMVVTEDTRYFSYSMQSYWGVAEDITFRDVDINWDPITQGGRPRLAYEAETYGGEGRTNYISGNKPANPPRGGLKRPAAEKYIINPILTVTGWGVDDVGVTKAEILANYDGSWVTIGEAAGGDTFKADIDLCETDVPDGFFKLAVRVWDYEGNPSRIVGTRELFKNVDCSVDPDVTITSPYLPEIGKIRASVKKGSTGSAITSVEFWFLGRDLFLGDRVYLGKDTYGGNGWQVPISTVDLEEGYGYILFALATDAKGNYGAHVINNGTIDRTDPWLKINHGESPNMVGPVMITWIGGDNLSGIDHYSLEVNDVNRSDYTVREDHIPAATTYYELVLEPNQLLVGTVTIYDKSGNESTQDIAIYSNDYLFPFEFIIPVISPSN